MSAQNQSEELGRDALSVFFESLPDPVFVLDTEFFVRFANRAALDVLGYEWAEFAGMHIEELVPAELRERYRSLRSEVFNARGDGPVLRGERILLTKSGREVPVQLAMSRVTVGEREYLVSSFHDTSAQKDAEQETIERLTSLIEQAEVSVFLIQVTEDGTFLFETFNPVTERLTGMKREQARGRRPDQVVAPREAERVVGMYRRAVELGTPFTYEEIGETREGQRAFRTTLVPIRERSGAIRRLIGMSQDITEQKRIETALAEARKSLLESEEKSTKAFRASPHPIGITDLRTGTLLEVNDAFERVFGHPREEALGKTTVELGIWGAEARAKMLEQLSDRRAFRDLPMQAKRRDGRGMSVLLSGEVIELGASSCLVTYVHDVTEHEAAQMRLLQSEERFARAFRASPDALTIVDVRTGRVLEVNEGFERLFKLTRGEIVGRSTFELALWADPLEREDAKKLLFKSGTLRDFPIVARATSGERRECLLSAELIELSEGPAVIGNIRDVTDARKAERAKADLEAQLRQAQKMEALGTLAGGIAHDFNNILGAILAYSELIRLDVHLPQQVESYVVELRRAGERAKDLVQQILTFSRRQPQQRRPVRIEIAVRDALNLLRSTLPATIRIESTVAADTPVVLADVTQIHQVLTNLGTNAAHAMKRVPGTLRIALDSVDIDPATAPPTPELDRRRYARLRVSDTGEGMAGDTLKHIFEPFFTTKAPGEGSGLGLAVVHGIVRDHEGAITVESEAGRGTTVTVYLPEHEAALEEQAAPKLELVRANGERVLFIDDEAVLCRSVSSLLERLGYSVTARTDPSEAVELFKKAPQNYDVVLTDLTMPGMTGVDVAREIQRLAPEKPVLMMSGFHSTWTPEALRALGVVDLIRKPLGADQLSRTLAQVFARSRN
jgi:PAS domain S-box-containing protein